MRKHLLHCLMQNEMDLFNGEMLKRKKMVKETQLLEIICTCRSIGTWWNATFARNGSIKGV